MFGKTCHAVPAAAHCSGVISAPVEAVLDGELAVQLQVVLADRLALGDLSRPQQSAAARTLRSVSRARSSS